MLKNGIFCEMVILVVFKGFLLVRNLEILTQIVLDSPIYYYLICVTETMVVKTSEIWHSFRATICFLTQITQWHHFVGMLGLTFSITPNVTSVSG